MLDKIMIGWLADAAREKEVTYNHVIGFVN